MHDDVTSLLPNNVNLCLFSVLVSQVKKLLVSFDLYKCKIMRFWSNVSFLLFFSVFFLILFY